jgi:hypothetical protein
MSSTRLEWSEPCSIDLVMTAQERVGRRTLATASTVAAIALFLVACSGASGISAEPDATDGPASTAPTGDVPGDVLDEIVSDAAERAGVGTDDVEVVTAEAVTWSDGSLGCPEPGMMYTQALVPGYRVVLRAGDETLNFHAAQSGDFRFCEKPRPPAEGSGNQ